MTDRERNLNIFRKKPIDRVLFQPRLETWYFKNKETGKLPDRYKNMGYLELYRDLKCSCRPYGMFNPCLEAHTGGNVKIKTIKEQNKSITIWETPVGEIYKVSRQTNLAWHVEKYPVSSPEDMKVIEYILRETTWNFNMEKFREKDAQIGDMAAPTIFIPRINYQRLVIDYMGFENTLYAMYDYPTEFEHLIKVINETDRQMLEVVALSPVELINFGDNIDQNLLSPKIFQEYILPEYHYRAEFLHKHGKYVFAHFDGSVKNLLPYLRKTHLDGIEALTPVPQGDVTIEEIKEALGDDMILVDGIPMTDFLPYTPIEQLEEDVEKLVKLFTPNLVLGISDEISEVCDIERVRLVSEMVLNTKL